MNAALYNITAQRDEMPMGFLNLLISLVALEKDINGVIARGCLDTKR